MDAADTYSRFARYYDVYADGFRDDLPLYLAACRKRQRILEIGCGTGRVLQALLEAGHAVTGVDISEDMLRVARRKLSRYARSGKLRLLKHNYVNEPLREMFDRVLVPWYTVNYLLSDAECVKFLQNVYRDMPPKGVVIMDLYYPRPLRYPSQLDPGEEKSFVVGGKTIRLRDSRKMVNDIEERIQTYCEGSRQTTITTLRRYIPKAKIADFLRRTGFTGIQATDGYRASRFREIAGGEEPAGGNFVIRAAKP